MEMRSGSDSTRETISPLAPWSNARLRISIWPAQRRRAWGHSSKRLTRNLKQLAQLPCIPSLKTKYRRCGGSRQSWVWPVGSRSMQSAPHCARLSNGASATDSSSAIVSRTSCFAWICLAGLHADAVQISWLEAGHLPSHTCAKFSVYGAGQDRRASKADASGCLNKIWAKSGAD